MAEKLGIYGFLRLSMNERANVTWNEGTFLHNRKGNGFHGNLYAVEDFYVEVLYDTARNTVVDVTPFKSLDLLQPYLDTIDLSGLM
jgi:hypothetical protein